MFTRSTNRRFVKIALVIAIAGLIIGYAVTRSFNYAQGPSIEIASPTDGSATSSKTVNIFGQANRVNNLSLNGNPVTIDEMGNFNENIIIFRGINILTLEARDQFGRKIQKQLHIVGI